MNKQLLEGTLAAGGMLPAKAKVDESISEFVVARTYSGPALGNRKIVRLGAERLGPAEDLALEFLGLTSEGESQPIARQGRRALGFASWALINHPKTARYALGLVKRMKAAARKAKSKPGHAWDAFVEMASELNVSVREFLPPYWEEVARTYRDVGSSTYAGRAIGKALDAERVHALDVDPARRRDAILEFALSGCLSAKALGEYIRDLPNHFEPDEAFSTLRDLLVRRTLGGMPPLPTTIKEITKFAKAAGLSADDEVESLLWDIIKSPAMSRAPKQFWTSASKHVKKLVQESDEFGLWLIVHTSLDSSYYDVSPAWSWFEFLEQWDVLPLLSKPSSEYPDGVELPGGHAGWLSKLICVDSPSPPRVFEIIDLCTDQILASGKTVTLGKSGYRNDIDVDVVERLLALKIPVECTDGLNLDFADWTLAETDHPLRNSSLENLLQHDELREMFKAQLPVLLPWGVRGVKRGMYGRPDTAAKRSFDDAAEAHEPIHAIWKEFLDQHLDKVENGALVDFAESAATLSSCVRAATIRRFPDVLKRLKKVDPAAALQRSLSIGVIDEYGWKELDDAADQEPMPPLHRRMPRIALVFPYVMAFSDTGVRQIGPDGLAAISDWTMRSDSELAACYPIGGDALVVYQDSNTYQRKVLWLNTATQPVDSNQYFWHDRPPKIAEFDQGLFAGNRILEVGQTKVPSTCHWLTDGDRYWAALAEQWEWDYATQSSQFSTPEKLVEVDPLTGKRGRNSVPPILESNLPAGAVVRWKHSDLCVAPDCVQNSPLGMSKNLIGGRVAALRDKSHQFVGVDGRECRLEKSTGFIPVAMVDQPAGKSSWIICQSGQIIEAESGLAFATTDYKYASGQPTELPLIFWNYFTVRCPKSSQRLRKTKLADAKKLLEAGKITHQAEKVREDKRKRDPKRRASLEAAKKLLPNAPERLIKGVARIGKVAAIEAGTIERIIERAEAKPRLESVTPGKAAADSKSDIQSDSETLATYAEGFSELQIPLRDQTDPTHSYRSTGFDGYHLVALVKFLKGDAYDHLPGGGADILAMLDDMPSAAWTAFWNSTASLNKSDIELKKRVRGQWLVALKFWAASGIADIGGSMNVYVSELLDESEQKRLSKIGRYPTSENTIVFRESGISYVVYAIENYGENRVLVLAHTDKKSGCKPPRKYSIAEEIELERRWDSKAIRKFVGAVEQIDTLPLPSPEMLAATSKKLGMAPVEVGLLWLANMRTVRYGQEKLTKEIRTHFKWKLVEIKQAIAALDASPPVPSYMSEHLVADPAAWAKMPEGPAFDRFVESIATSREDRLAIPVEIIAKLQRLFSNYYGYGKLDLDSVEELLVSPADSELLTPSKATFHQSKERYETLTAKGGVPAGELSFLQKLFRAACLINYELPVGDPIRQKLPDLLAAMQNFVQSPKTSLPFGGPYAAKDWGEDFDADEALARYEKLIGPSKKSKDGLRTFDDGLIYGVLLAPAVMLHFRPSALDKSPDAYDRLRAIAAATFSWEGSAEDELDFVDFVRDVNSDECSQLQESNRSPTSPEGSWEQNPLTSCPKLVASAAKKLKTSDNAACLYLQVLALHDPTTANIKRWNEWSAKQIKTATEELLEKQLLVEAKRSRAGRTFFLPGGWEELKLPNLPLESWKLTMFGYENTDTLRGASAEVIVCPRTVTSQFELAWQRVQDGDAPRYKEAGKK